MTNQQTNLFKKVAVFTDLHLGLKANSSTHNNDCEDFIDWFIATAKANGCETGMFLGDFHHNRSALNIVTMDYSLRCLEKLGKAFEEFYFFPGNHDLYYKDKREVHSAEFGKYIPGITIVTHPMTIGGVTLCPWLVGEEWKSVSNNGGKYIFGHFELPGFMMNAMVKMPEHGDISVDQLNRYELGFSGHFHKRQHHKNMIYIGNAFPHNYADAGDDERGMMILEWGGTPEFHSWPAQPTFRTYRLSDVIDKPDELLKPRMHCKVTIDLPISFEEANFIKDTYVTQYELRELNLIQQKQDIDSSISAVNIDFKSVDTIVVSEITNIESPKFKNEKLISIYNEL